MLNEMHAMMPGVEVRYWRDKQHHEIDFAIPVRGKAPVAIECKWSAGSDVDGRSLASFRHRYQGGLDLVVAHDVDRPFTATVGGLRVTWVGLTDMVTRLREYARS